MGEDTRMSGKEMARIPILERLQKGELNQRQASQLMRISKRQSQRLKKRYANGSQDIAHKGRNRSSNRQIKACDIAAVMNIVREKYADFGPTLAHEHLKQDGKISFGVEILRRAMMEAGLWKSKSRKAKRNHMTRERRPCFGELVQIDGSLHQWFEDRGPMCSLLAYIDDATSSVVHAQFVESESTWSYFEATKAYFKTHGRPLSVYTDKHSVFRINASKEGQSATSDSHGDTQFGRALKMLEVEIIYAQTPQAKGRVERLYQTLQDRLVKALRLAKISTIDAANAFLPKYLADHNQRFAVDPQDSSNLHRPLDPAVDVERVFLLQESRSLSDTLTCQYKNKAYQIHHDKANYTLAKAKITVLENREGQVFLDYRGKPLRFSVIQTKPLNNDVDTKTLNSVVDHIKKKVTKQTPAATPHKPAATHPWRNYPQPLQPTSPIKQLVA